MLTRSRDRKVANLVSPNGKSPVIANAFGIPAGVNNACPGATSFCEKICYAGRNERQYKNVSSVVKRNFAALLYADYLDGIDGMVEELSAMIAEFDADCDKRNADKYFRIHWDGDFFSADYAKAWAIVCRRFPDIRFWVYTRSFDIVPHIVGIDNLVVYLSADPVNKEAANVTAALYNIPIATVADTFDEAMQNTFASPYREYKCPENRKSIDLIGPKGSACGRCGICIDGRGDVLFSVKKR